MSRVEQQTADDRGDRIAEGEHADDQEL